jgi:hypothetical protein
LIDWLIGFGWVTVLSAVGSCVRRVGGRGKRERGGVDVRRHFMFVVQ